MRNRIAFGILVALCALAFSTPASAAVVNGVDYLLLAKNQILMENSDKCPNPPPNPTALHCMFLQGNVGVSDPNGRIRIGANNIISNAAGTATVTAHEIVFGSFSKVDICRFDISSGADPLTVCGTIVSPLPAGTLPLFAGWTPTSGPLGPVPVEACTNTATSVTVGAGLTASLPFPGPNATPGCYKVVTVNAGATLNLSAGNYKIQLLKVLAGATINGAGVAATTVNVQSPMVTEAGVKLNDMLLESPGTPAFFSVKEFLSIGNFSTVKNVIFYVPSAAVHLHLGTVGDNFETVANFITVEPIVVETVNVVACACFEQMVLSGNNVFLSFGHKLNDPGNKFFLSSTCDPAAGVQVNATASTDSTATLDVTGQVTAGKHVIVQSTAGTFCSATTL
jgi:hypothetical protein